MLDIKLIRENPEMVRANLERRHQPEKLELLQQVADADKRWRELTAQVNGLRKRRNDVSQEIAQAMKAGKDASSLKAEASRIPDEINAHESELEAKQAFVKNGLMRLPNLLHESVPYGKDDKDNVVVKVWGEPPKFGFSPSSHAELSQSLGIADFERAAKVTGTGFYYLRNEMALLDYSIMRYAMDLLLSRGYSLIEPPYMIRRSFYEGVTDLGDFENVMYRIEDSENLKDPLYLIATSEHPMGAMLKDEILNADQLPIKMCGVSPCFRREIGSHGKYTKGIFRVHQFNKIEQFIFCLPEQSWELHEELQRNSEALYEGLGLHYRVVNVCTGDIGSIAAKKYDMEAWMADGEFREVGSNSNCTDYQARRLNTRYRMKEGQAPAGFVHTLNNTAIATSRTMIMIMEQYQQADGTIKVPKALQKYMGMKTIEGKLNKMKI
ncbi:serine--tRNA ligase [Candidatus Bathyarchaeota archaeon RBG_13_52_12]|nr:MAG: serine--tRNA ligase [Candidatus Bathyarchaeota archaeon RBG_13_52_12]